MRKVLGLVLVGFTSSMVAACSDTTTPQNPAATAGAAGATAVGGGGAAQTGGSGGSATTAGNATVMGGMSGSGGGSGGASPGGSGGAVSGGGGGQGGGASHVPVPSAGCTKANPTPPEGSQTIMTGGQSAMYNVNLPDGYDPTKPMPLGFGFHGFGNGACGPTQGECRGFAMLPAVTVYMKSISDGWEQGAVLEQNITYWQDVLAHMKAEYCIDESRVFIAGVSSGGQFIEHLTCRFGDMLWQTTAVCAGPVGSATNNCKGTPPLLIIHGVTDNLDNNGLGVAEIFAERNGCSEALPAGFEQARAEMQAARDAEEAKHVCLDWEGCTKNPLRFCISSQITYNNLTHGWPMVGGELIGDFQDTLQ
jgi:polyhydroxybutyrate depolymerase